MDPQELPKKYFNILPRLPRPLDPPLHPGTRQPISPEMLEALFPKEIIRQEMSTQPSIPIPEPVREALRQLGRPTPLYRAVRLEKFLKTPAKIYFKREDVNPCGSHKPNTAVAQAHYARQEGIERLCTETGAGQWGTALAYAGALFGLDVNIFMVRTSYFQKPHRQTLMRVYGARVQPSPSTETDYGKKVLADNPNHPGSLGIAISEALEAVMKTPNAKYALGSVLNHVMLHQTVIGQETLMQLKQLEVVPDLMFGCVGGGSNFAGFAFPAIGDRLAGKTQTRFIAAEPTDVASLTKGEYRYDHGDTAGMTPLMKMHTLGKDFVPSPIHAGGLRYHGMAPTVSLLAEEGIIEARAFDQNEIFDAAVLFAKTEGIVAAPESAHAIAAVVQEARACKQSGEAKTLVFNLSGHGLLDLNGYAAHLEGKRP